jgi:Kef-type K+ transport system membrane component KefB
MNKNLLFYILVLLLFGTGIWLMLESGSRLNRPENAVESHGEPPPVTPSTAPTGSEGTTSHVGRILRESLRDPLSILLLQMIVIILAARLVGALFVKIGQPAVIGEMVAGILLGPSLLGALSPETMSFLFPASSMGALRLLSQIGVIIFMFIVGTELNAQHLREKAHAAVMISHASIIAPFFLGVALSLAIYRSLASPATSFTSFALFMGIAMSITAFPVLARIIEERGMTKSYLGSTTIACAAVDDVTAWCMLAVVVAVAKAEGVEAAASTILMVLLFIGVMIFLIRPRLNQIIKEEVEYETKAKKVLASVLVFVFACSCFTEIIGIHALFGAFLAGVVSPSSAGFRSFLRNRLEAFSLVALLPIFFAFTGLRTQVNLLNDWQSWLLCVGIIAVAIAGKLGGSMLAARFTGISWEDSFSIGVLMNTRGLIELIVLNIGYDLGILPARIFSIMVLMALVTTAMAGPLLSWVKSKEQTESILAQGVGSGG